MQHKEYLKGLQEAIKAVHGCEASYVESVPVKSVFNEQIAWEGMVEVFNILHPKAKKCYAWGYEEEEELKTTAVLEIPPVDSPQSAVAVAIAAKSRK